MTAITGVGRWVDVIVDRAKIDRHGVYWAAGARYRRGTMGNWECSLGYGTPGILLALLEYYRFSRDFTIAEIIHKAVTWTQTQARSRPWAHGFYGGDGGLLYLLLECDRIVPGCAGVWQSDVWNRLGAMPEPRVTNVDIGTAGTILGILALVRAHGSGNTRLLLPLRDRLLAQARLADTGVYWDFNRVSLRPPVGFLSGNAGIDYCLAHLGRQLHENYAPIYAGSLAYACSQFDPDAGNWPDQDATARLQSADQQEIESYLLQVAKSEPELVAREYSLGWATGLMGIFLSRVTLATSGLEDRIGRLCAKDCAVASERLARIGGEDLKALDWTMQNGLAGFAVTLRHLAPLATQAALHLPDRLLSETRESLADRRPAEANDDMSLFTGAAGMVYSLLKMESADGSCFDPLGPPSPKRAGPPDTPVDLSPLLRQQLPACAAIASTKETLAREGVSLASVEGAVADHCAREPGSVLARSVKHEIDRHHVMARTSFRAHFWRETVARKRFLQRYAEGMDDILCYERFRLADGVRLFSLDFDPYAQRELASGKRMFVVQSVGSTGVTEATLSALQFALLEGFRQPAVALDVVARVVSRVNTATAPSRRVSQLALGTIRNFVETGLLTAAPMGRLQASLSRVKRRRMHKILFSG